MNNLNLISYLPKYYRKSKVVKNMVSSTEFEIAKLNIALNELLNDLCITTSIKTIERFEKIVGINNNSKTLEERRSKVLAKLKCTGTTTIEAIKEICKSFVNKVDIIENNENYAFKIILESNKGFPYKLDSLYNYIEEIKPAHLATEYSLISIVNLRLNYACASLGGEKITVYPYCPKDIESKCKVNVAIGNNTSCENITIYPKKEE